MQTPKKSLCLFGSLLLVSFFALTGCGYSTPPQCSASGFINDTSATDAQLKGLWQGAQQQLATQPIPVDPVTSPGNITYAAPNSQALNVEPACQVTVVTEANVLPASGQPGFACSESPTGYCGGMTLGAGPWTVEVVTPDLLNPGATGWEFQNVILEKLGYNVEGR
jgi:hypothetical protein